MTNRADARGRHTLRGYVGEYRLAWKADYQPVLNIAENGRRDGVRYFATEIEAENAAWRAKNDLEQSVMTRSGEIIPRPRREAEMLFEKRSARV